MDDLIHTIETAGGWTVLKWGEDMSGPYVAALSQQSGQAHQFRSAEDWAINSGPIAAGQWTGNLGMWAERQSQELP